MLNFWSKSENIKLLQVLTCLLLGLNLLACTKAVEPKLSPSNPNLPGKTSMEEAAVEIGAIGLLSLGWSETLLNVAMGLGDSALDQCVTTKADGNDILINLGGCGVTGEKRETKLAGLGKIEVSKNSKGQVNEVRLSNIRQSSSDLPALLQNQDIANDYFSSVVVREDTYTNVLTLSVNVLIKRISNDSDVFSFVENSHLEFQRVPDGSSKTTKPVAVFTQDANRSGKIKLELNSKNNKLIATILLESLSADSHMKELSAKSNKQIEYNLDFVITAENGSLAWIDAGCGSLGEGNFPFTITAKEYGQKAESANGLIQLKNKYLSEMVSKKSQSLSNLCGGRSISGRFFGLDVQLNRKMNDYFGRIKGSGLPTKKSKNGSKTATLPADIQVNDELMNQNLINI